MKGICSTHRAYPQCCLGTQNLTLSRTLSRGSQETLRWAKSKLLSFSRCQKLKWGLQGSTFIRSGCKTYSWTYVIVSILPKNQNSFVWITDIQPNAFYTIVQMVVPPMAPETQAQLVLCLEGAPLYPISQQRVFTLPEAAKGWKNASLLFHCFQKLVQNMILSQGLVSLLGY